MSDEPDPIGVAFAEHETLETRVQQLEERCAELERRTVSLADLCNQIAQTLAKLVRG